MRETDPILPTHAKGPLFGVFHNNHLVAMLLLIMACPAGAEWQELRDCLEQGIFMEVFRYADVAAHHEAFVAAMASGNFDASFSMAEDELAMMLRLSDAMHSLNAKAGRSLFETVLDQVAPLAAGNWSQNDLARFWNFCSTTDKTKLRFMAAFYRYMVDAVAFRIVSGFFQNVCGVNAKYQAVRLALVVVQISADPGADCREPRRAGHTHAYLGPGCLGPKAFPGCCVGLADRFRAQRPCTAILGYGPGPLWPPGQHQARRGTPGQCQARARTLQASAGQGPR